MTSHHHQKASTTTPERPTRLFCRLLMTTSLGLLAAPCPAATTPTEIKFTVSHFNVDGTSPLSQQAMDSYLQPLQHRQYNLKQLQEVANGLEAVIREQGHPFYRVSLPPQTLDGGEVKLHIVAFTLGKIDVGGNRYFTKDNIIASMPGLAIAKSPNTQELSQNLKVANKHPAKQISLTFKKSQTDDQIDAKINVAEQHPFQASVMLNTVGTKGTGNFRLTGALQHSNLWGLDHIINGSYTTSPDHADKVEQYGASYSLPLYRLKGWLSGYYAHSNINNGVVATDLAITGSGEMAGLHYQQLLPKLGQYEHWLDFGLDNRYFINDIQFQNTQVGANVRSSPVSVLYKAEYPWQNTHTSYHVQWVGNTGIGDSNSQADYRAARLNAKQNWNLLRYGANMFVNISQWLVQTQFTAQYSGDSLIAGEQLGIGGSYDVRGYQERETSADTGEIVKVEITTPSWQKISLFAFYDYGHGYQNTALPAGLKDWNLSSTGIGANWQWQDHLMAKIAVANALNNAVSTHAGDSRIHASIVLRF
ncbi:MAG: ShlB/FhaC/HecB family hemolysin secretion/activation protein [Methylovulum sp.]|nr:ShlB/FhaC/HecB family hemolysin secretion/activation protein [Methylovulum sp.]